MSFLVFSRGAGVETGSKSKRLFLIRLRRRNYTL